VDDELGVGDGQGLCGRARICLAGFVPVAHQHHRAFGTWLAPDVLGRQLQGARDRRVAARLDLRHLRENGRLGFASEANPATSSLSSQFLRSGVD
jgi:hypothetical protein